MKVKISRSKHGENHPSVILTICPLRVVGALELDIYRAYSCHWARGGGTPRTGGRSITGLIYTDRQTFTLTNLHLWAI